MEDPKDNVDVSVRDLLEIIGEQAVKIKVLEAQKTALLERVTLAETGVSTARGPRSA